jgi:hypothetical protein
MSYEVTAEVWTDKAVAALIGQRVQWNGRDMTITEAWTDADGRVIVRLRIDASPEPFSLGQLTWILDEAP